MADTNQKNMIQEKSCEPMNRNDSKVVSKQSVAKSEKKKVDDSTMAMRSKAIAFGGEDYYDFEADIPHEVLQNAGVPRGRFCETNYERRLREEEEVCWYDECYRPPE